MGAPLWTILFAMPSVTIAVQAKPIARYASTIVDTNFNPPHRSGCVGMSCRSMRDINHRNLAYDSCLHTQPRTRTIKSGKLTIACHLPTSEKDVPPLAET